MSKHEDTKARVLSGTCNAGIQFDEMCHLMNQFGFSNRTKGSHHIFHKSGVHDIINLQPSENGKAKPYQVRQVARLIKLYNL